MFKQKRMLLIFLLPGLAGLTIFYLAPFVYGMYFSVTDGTRVNAFVGMKNYIDVWHNQMFLLGLKNTLELSLICAPLVFVVSFLLAAMLIIFLLIFDFGGPINRVLELLGQERVLWKESAMMRVPVVVLYVWKNIGFSVVIFASALQAVPKALYEYASLDGAGRLRQEISITLPLVSPTAFLVFVLSWINAFKIFREVYFISGAYPDPACYTLQHFMNNQFSKLNYQFVTTAAYSFAAIVIVFFGVLALLENRRRVVM